MQPPARVTVGKNVGLHVSWFVYRGKGAATFTPEQIMSWEDTRVGANSPWAPVWVPPPMPPNGKVTVQVDVREPGVYVLRSRADDGALTADGEVTITVIPVDSLRVPRQASRQVPVPRFPKTHAFRIPVPGSRIPTMDFWIGSCSSSSMEEQHMPTNTRKSSTVRQRHRCGKASEPMAEQRHARHGLLGGIKQNVTSRVDEQKNRAADGLGGIANVFRTAGNELRSENEAVAAYVDMASDQLKRFADQIRQKGVTDMLDDVHDFARRRPALVHWRRVPGRHRDRPIPQELGGAPGVTGARRAASAASTR